MDLKARITNDMKEAMKAQQATRLGTIRMLLSEIKKREIDNRTADDRSGLSEADILKAISSMIKQRNDSIEQFTKGGRADLAAKEKEEIDVLSAYLPAQMGRDEIEKLVVAVIAETGAKSPNDIGKVMKAVIAKAEGKADGKVINEIARTKLTAS